MPNDINRYLAGRLRVKSSLETAHTYLLNAQFRYEVVPLQTLGVSPDDVRSEIDAAVLRVKKAIRVIDLDIKMLDKALKKETS